PDVVGDGGIDVPLQMGVVRQPAPRLGVEVELLGLLAAIAAALPGIEGTAQATRVRQPAGGIEAAEAVAQQAAGDLRDAPVEEREDEQLVPEHVATVGLAMQTAGRHSDVEVV